MTRTAEQIAAENLSDAAEITRCIAPIIETLRPACVKLEVAGSLRRGKPRVHDAEIVLLPIRDIVATAPADLFGEAPEAVGTPALDAAIADLTAQNLIYPDIKVPRMGDKLKRFVLIESEMQAPLELYIAEEANYGNLLAIRTGSAIYSHAFVTPYGVPVKDAKWNSRLRRTEEGGECPAAEGLSMAHGRRGQSH